MLVCAPVLLYHPSPHPARNGLARAGHANGKRRGVKQMKRDSHVEHDHVLDGTRRAAFKEITHEPRRVVGGGHAQVRL